AVDTSRGQRSNLTDLARALAELAALGHPVALALWDDTATHAHAAVAAKPAHKPGLTLKVCGANPVPIRRTDDSSSPTTRCLSNRDAPFPMPPATAARLAQSYDPQTNGTGTATQNGHPAVATQPSGAPVPDLGSSDPAVVVEALRTVQDNLVALQKLGE